MPVEESRPHWVYTTPVPSSWIARPWTRSSSLSTRVMVTSGPSSPYISFLGVFDFFLFKSYQ